MPLFIIIACIAAAVLYAVINLLNRRWDALIRSREDYDEDVDGKQTKAEKAAFEARKAEEAKLTRMPFGDVYKERPNRFIGVIIWGVILSGLAVWYFMTKSDSVSIEEALTNKLTNTLALIKDPSTGTVVGIIFLLLLYAIYTLEALIDFDTCEIPFELNILIGILGVLSIFLWPHVTIVERIIGLLCVAGPLILLDLIIPNAFGWGDIRLLYMSGILLGWKILVAGFFIGAVIQALIAVFFVITKKKDWKSHIPFGPMLCLGIIISTAVGTNIINWYIGVIKTSMGR
jgi:Type II secretory pathway, prepilin signal peptidase PulO and related peptidases